MITDQHARRVFVLQVAGLTVRYTSHDIDPSSSNMSAALVDGINYTNQRAIVDVGAFSGSIDPSGGIASYGAVTISLASDRARGGETDPAVIFGRCGSRATAPFKAQIIEDLKYETNSGTLDIDDSPSSLSFPAVMHIGAESIKVTGYTSITGGARITYTARAVGGSQRQDHRLGDFGTFVPEVTSAITTFRGRRASLWAAQQYPDGSLSDFVELVNGFLDSSPIVEEGGVVSLSLLPISALIDTELSNKASTSTKLLQNFHYFDGKRASWFDWGVGLDNDSVYYIDKYLIDEVAGTFEFSPIQHDNLQMFSSILPDGYDENYATPHPRYTFLEAPGVKVYLIPGGYDTAKSEGLYQSGTEEGADFYRVRTNPKIENKAVKLGSLEVKPWPDVLRAELSSDDNFDLTPIGNERSAWAHLSIGRGGSVRVRATKPPGVTRPYIILSNTSLKRLVVDGKAYEPKRWVGDGFGNGIVPYEPFGNVARIGYPLDLRQEGSERGEREGIKLKLSVPDNDDNTTASYNIRDIARAWYQRRELTILVEGSLGLPNVPTSVSYDLQVKFTDRDLGEERYQWIKATHESVATYNGVNIGYLIHLDRLQDWSEITSFGDWSDTERVEIFGGARFSRERPGEIMLKLLQSGGGSGRNGSYDVYSLGLGIPSSDIDESSFLAYDGISPFIFSGSLSGEGANLRDVVQDILKLMGCALIMSRSSTGASQITLQPIGAEVSLDVKATIGEGDWLADKPPTWSIYEDIVTQIGVNYNWLIKEGKFTSQLTFNNQEAINRYGGERSKIDLNLYALTGEDIGGAVGDVTGAFLPVMARLWRLLSNPIREWKGSIGTGQSMLLDVGSYVSVSSPLLKGYGDEWGVSNEVGMVRSIRQDLMREGAEIELISIGLTPVRWNASVEVKSVIDSISVSISNDVFTSDPAVDSDFFAVGDVVDYLPLGDEDNAITGLVIKAVSTTVIIFASAHGITATGGTLEPTSYNSASERHKGDAYLASNTSPPLLGSSTEAQEYS